MNAKVFGFIFARGGSKGVPGKNVRPLQGKPLIAYAIECGLKSNVIDKVLVSTDDLKIAEVALKYGAEVPFMRPAELAGDRSPEWLAWRHAIQTVWEMKDYGPFDVFVAIPTTSPLRWVADLDDCIQTLRDSRADLVLTVTPAARNPYFNQVVLDKDGGASLAIPADKNMAFRQSAPAVYDVTTVAYAARPQFVLEAENMWEGRVATVLVPPERALDIDTELDFRMAEFLISQSGQEF